MRRVNHRILAIALPAIVSNITTPLLGMLDTAIVGHLGAALYIGAIAVGASMFNMLYWLCGFLRMGSSGVAAQAYGCNDRTECFDILWRSLSVAIVIGLLFILLRYPLSGAVLRFLDADDATQPLATDYFSIVILGAPAVLGSLSLSGWLLGMQNTKAIMWVAILTNVVNLCVSYWLVFIAGWGIRGVAYGTLTSQWTGFLVTLLYIFLHFHPYYSSIRRIFALRKLRNFFSINSDIFLRTLCLVGVTVWFTRNGAQQGVLVLSANSILMQMFLFFSYFMDGFAYAGEALVGKYAGRGSRKAMNGTINYILRWATVMALLFAAIYFCVGEVIIKLITTDHDVINVAIEYLPWAVTVPLVGVTAFVYDGVFIGLARTRPLLLSMFAATIVYFISYIVLKPTFGNHGLWLSFCCYLLIRGVVLHRFWHRVLTHC